MKLTKAIGTGLIAISLLGLFGCEKSNSSSRTETGSSTAANDQGTQNTDQTQPNQNSQSSGNSQGNGDQTGQSSGSNQNSESNQTATTSQHTPPKTKQEALTQISKLLKTKVPLLIPKNIPVNEGKFLTATTTSQTWYYRINFYETDQPAIINSQAAAKGTLIATAEGTEYKDSVSAAKAINGYIQVDVSQNPVDLGHGIKGTMEGAMGHSYIMWNEGRWSIKLDSPNDPAYQNKQYPDGRILAQNIVTFLNDHTLPAPQKIGVITIHNWQQSPTATVIWQNHEMTYQITSADPMKALEIAVH